MKKGRAGKPRQSKDTHMEMNERGNRNGGARHQEGRGAVGKGKGEPGRLQESRQQQCQKRNNLTKQGPQNDEVGLRGMRFAR